MYQVLLAGREFKENILFAELQSDVEAVQLALALHQSSNKPHNITVINSEDSTEPVVRFFVPEKSQ